jgi:hypothetical protein
MDERMETTMVSYYTKDEYYYTKLTGVTPGAHKALVSVGFSPAVCSSGVVRTLSGTRLWPSETFGEHCARRRKAAGQ